MVLDPILLIMIAVEVGWGRTLLVGLLLLAELEARGDDAVLGLSDSVLLAPAPAEVVEARGVATLVCFLVLIPEPPVKVETGRDETVPGIALVVVGTLANHYEGQNLYSSRKINKEKTHQLTASALLLLKRQGSLLISRSARLN